MHALANLPVDHIEQWGIFPKNNYLIYKSFARRRCANNAETAVRLCILQMFGQTILYTGICMEGEADVDRDTRDRFIFGAANVYFFPFLHFT